MDEATHKEWCPLHLRAALGETLSAEEQMRYETGLRQLDDEESRIFEVARLKQEERLRQVEAERCELETRRQQLQTRIAQLGTAISKREKQARPHHDFAN